MRNSFHNLIRNTFSVVLIVCAISGQRVLADSGGPYDLSWSTIDGGGGRSSGGTYTLTGTIGQHDTGEMSGGDYNISGGFWIGGSFVSCFVDFEDFAEFAKRWLDAPCGPDNNWCGGADLDSSGDVTITDLNEVAYFWLDYCPLDWPWE